MQNHRLVIISLIGIFILSMGCIDLRSFPLLPSLTCPVDCSDGLPCTQDICSQDTEYRCQHLPINGEVNMCSGDVDECHMKTCNKGMCVTDLKQYCAYGVECEDFNVISPAYEFYKSINQLPSFACSVTNIGKQQGSIQITSEVEGYSNEFEKSVSLRPGESKDVGINLVYDDEFYDLPDARSAILKTKMVSGAYTLYSDSKSVQIEKSSVFSPNLGDEGLIAMWVTYNDPCIEEIISEAKKFTPSKQFVGYLGDEDTMYWELAAIFYSLYYQDIKYVSSTFTSTNVAEAMYNQDIRFPYRSLKYKQMNCIDGAVLYAAILEKLDYQTGIAFIPGHAFVLVRDFDGSWIPIETTMTGDDISSFDDAVYSGYDSMQDPDLFIIDVHAAIESGITPMPLGENHECNVDDLTEEATAYQEYLSQSGSQSGNSGDCYDVDYGYMTDGACSYDKAAYCQDGLVYWAIHEECGSVYPNCIDTDYGLVYNGYCSSDSQAYCENGVMYWASYGECG